MAKKKKAPVNKSEAIRTYKAENPDAMPKEMAEALTKQHGVQFTAAAVSTTLYNAAKKPATKKKATAVRQKKVEPATNPLNSAIKFVKAAGGLKNAKAALEQIEEIKNL